MSEEALQITKERGEAKSKGEMKRYTQLNAGFQRIAGKDKAAFFNEQCTEVEENNRMGKTGDLFKKIEDNQGNISCKGRHDNGQNIKDLAEKRLRRGGKNIQKNHTKKVLMTGITTMVWSLTYSWTS